MVARQPIRLEALLPGLVISCRIRVGEDITSWAFEPSQIEENSPNFFRLEFQIPTFIAEILYARTQEIRENPLWQMLVDVKRETLCRCSRISGRDVHAFPAGARRGVVESVRGEAEKAGRLNSFLL